MSLNYPNQEDEFVIGTLASPVTLTTVYSGNTSNPFEVVHYAQLTFCVQYITGAGGATNSIQVKIEGSPDLLDNDSVTPIYYQETSSLTSAGTITHTAAEHTFTGAASATTYRVFFYAPPAFKTLRVSVKETVVGGSAGTASVRLITSGK